MYLIQYPHALVLWQSNNRIQVPKIDGRLVTDATFWFYFCVWVHLCMTTFFVAGWPFIGEKPATPVFHNGAFDPKIALQARSYKCCLDRPRTSQTFPPRFEYKRYYHPCDMQKLSCYPNCPLPEW